MPTHRPFTKQACRQKSDGLESLPRHQIGLHCPDGQLAQLRGHWAYMPRELNGFDFLLIDEPPDRVFRPERDMMLDLLADHLFERHPVRDDAGEPDEAATEEARTMYAMVRFVLNGMQNGYWPAEAMTAAGCDVAFFDRFVELTDRRDHKTGMTAATPDDERVSMARTSFRNAVRRLCSFGRLARAIQGVEEGAGRIGIAGDAPHTANLRPRARLHPSLLAARVMVIGARLEPDAVRRWLPEAQPMGVAEMIPHAPYQTVVHFHRTGMGKRAMVRDARWAHSLVRLEGDDSRKDATGVCVYAACEDAFAGLPGVLAGHHGEMAGRKDWEKWCTTFLNFGSRFLSPPDAAAAGAAASGEPVPIKRPVLRSAQIAMRDGSSKTVKVPDYEHPAAAASLRTVRDFDVDQGPYGRPRGSNRTAVNPVLIIDAGSHAPQGVLVDVLITSTEQYAPDRMVMMLAEGLAVEHSHARNRLFKKIYAKPWTGQNDKRLEVGGFVTTALRVLCPSWRSAPREAWVIGRYWREGHARREAGEIFISRQRQLGMHMEVQRKVESAVRITVDRTIHPQRPAGEVTINPQKEDIPAFIVSSGEVVPGTAYREEKPPDRVERPPDG